MERREAQAESAPDAGGARYACQPDGAGRPPLIFFCDTSPPVNIYIKEDSRNEMQAPALCAPAIGVCRIARAAILAALSGRARVAPTGITCDVGRMGFDLLTMKWTCGSNG